MKEKKEIRERRRLKFIEPHGFDFAAISLRSLYISPTATVYMPASVDKVEGRSSPGKICRGCHGAGIAIPCTGFFNCSVVDSIYRFIAVVFEFISSKISCNVVSVLDKAANAPLPVCHSFYYQVFLDILYCFFAPRKQNNQERK